MNIRIPNNPQFNKYYTKHCKYLKLKGLQHKTIDAYARASRRIGNYFDSHWIILLRINYSIIFTISWTRSLGAL